jgi:hypothetical protein
VCVCVGVIVSDDWDWPAGNCQLNTNMVGANESDTARTQQPTTQPLSTRERRQIEKAKSKHEKARVKAARKESKRQSKIKRKQSKSSKGDVPNTEELPRHDEKWVASYSRVCPPHRAAVHAALPQRTQPGPALPCTHSAHSPRSRTSLPSSFPSRLLPLEAPVGEEALPQTQNHATDPSDTPLPTASPAVVDDPSLPVAERLGRSRQKLARVKNGEGLAIVTEMFGTVDTTLRGRGRTQEWELGARADRIQAPRNDVRTLPLTVEAVAQLGSTRTGEWWSSGSRSASPARTGDACSLLDVDGAGSAVDAVDTDACSLLDEDTEGRGDDTHPEMAWAPAMFRAADSFDGVSIDLAEAAMIMQLLFEKKQGTKFGPEVQTVAVQVLSKFCAGRPAKASRVLLTEFLRLVRDFTLQRSLSTNLLCFLAFCFCAGRSPVLKSSHALALRSCAGGRF